MNWLWALCFWGYTLTGFAPDTLENFESGAVELFSFPGEDVEPDSWHLDSVQTNNHSRYALKLFGNTWKVEQIAPVALDTGDVWTVAVYVESVAEIQGFGLVGDGETLLYSFAGTEQVDPRRWVTVYQGAFGLGTWNVYCLPVGEDWLSRFGHLGTVRAVVFVNDQDSTEVGAVYFDDILNITADLPVAPVVDIWYEQLAKRQHRNGSYHITIHFYSRVFDPDSRCHSYRWSFGDDSTSTDSCPVHTYVVRDDHTFTVLLEVCDSTGRWGRDSTKVQVEAGPTSFPLRLNFVGDVMLARRYELPGGIIDSLGPEGVFAQVKPYLSDGADISVANLECPLTNRGTPHPTKPIVFRGRPTNVRGLAYAGIDVVSLANNHIIDYGLEGLQQTQALLDSVGIKYSGAGANSYEAFLPLFLVKSGVNFAFLAYSDRTGQYDNYQPYLNAGYNKPGFAEQDTWRIFQAIRQAGEVSDCIVVQLHSGEEYCEMPNEQADEEWFFPWSDKPSASQREIRRRIIDNGADLVICHHPHILQGLEVYNGSLIAHSLGNFAFDQDYPETYPSVILNGLFDRRGFYRFFLIPVYIDDYIPKRAGGELAVFILRHLARLSREMNTYLVVNRESGSAEVVLDTFNLVRQNRQLQIQAELVPDSGWLVSVPLRLADWGDIVRVNNILPAGDWQFRLGRELVWFGNMEDEGATMWLLNQADEFYDTIFCRGQRSLCQRRGPGQNVLITNFEERLPVPLDSGELGLCGWVKAENGRSVNLILNCYNSRTGGMAVGACSLSAPLNGTFDWHLVQKSFLPPANGLFFDLWLKSKGADSGLARVWFDDAGVIKWDNWHTFNRPFEIISPNEYAYIQVRTRSPVNQADIVYEEMGYQAQTGIKSPSPVSALPPRLAIRPVPARRYVLIQFDLPRPARVNLRVFNSAGQLVRNLFEQNEDLGSRVVRWDLRDNRGKTVSCGTYFFSLATEGGSVIKKAVLVNTE
jgi:poly-gamma-glutamate synthesis protein (capsule biosynthesis protein)